MVTTNNNYLAKSGSKIVIYGRQQKQASIILQCDFSFCNKNPSQKINVFYFMFN